MILQTLNQRGVVVITPLFEMMSVQWTLCLVIVSHSIQAILSECEVSHDYYVASYGSDNSSCLESSNLHFPCATLWYVSRNFQDCATIKILDDLTVNYLATFER